MTGCRSTPRAVALVSAVLVFTAGVLGGCGNETLYGMELSRRLIIEAIGVDAAANGITLTLLTMNADGAADAGETDAPAEKSRCLTFRAKTIGEAAALAQQTTGLVPFFAHARVLVLGEAAAKTDVLSLLDFFLRNRTVRNTIPVCVASSAASLLSAAFSKTENPARELERALSTANGGGKSVNAPLFRFLDQMLSADTQAFCPVVSLYRTKGNEVEGFEARRTAVFSGAAFAFSLTPEETTALLLLRGELKESLIALPGAQTPAACRLQKARVQFCKPDTGTLRLRVRIRLEVQVTEAAAPLPPDNEENGQLLRLLRETLAEQINACFLKAYTLHGADLCRLRRRLRLPDDADVKKIQLRPEILLSFG